MKKVLVIILGLLLCIGIVPSTISKKFFINNSLIEDILPDKIPANFERTTSDLKIFSIESTSGGISITIKNIGAADITDVILEIKAENGLFISLPQKHFEIGTITAGSSISQFISVIGFGLGIYANFPKITLSVDSYETLPVIGVIVVRVIGSSVSIIGTLFDQCASSLGYSLFHPMWDRKTYLIDNIGNVVHTWTSLYPISQAAYLLENGNLVRTSIVAHSTLLHGGVQGRIEILDWDGQRIWMYEYATKEYCQHHDVEILPNGNILLIAWEVKTAKEAISAGKNPNQLLSNEFWPDHIIEIKPSGLSDVTIVWEWHVWDHLIQEYDPTKNNYGVVADHPELIDINYVGTKADWNHINSIDYNEEFDQILLSVKMFNEIWVIDHSTTTEQAAGHSEGRYGKGGDLLYRWGNPEAYQAGDNSDQKFFGQHAALWVEPGYFREGNIIIFNNEVGGQGNHYSSVEEIEPPIDELGFYEYSQGTAYGPDEQCWRYITPNPTDMYSDICSSAQRLPNGNTLICSASQGLFLEVTNEKEIIWKYNNPFPSWFIQKSVSEIIRYPLDYPGLQNIRLS
jgi:hypothetical protein